MGKLTVKSCEANLKKPGRHSDGNGLFQRVLRGEKAYWVFRYPATVDGKRTAREMSLGNYKFMSLAEARKRHTAEQNKVRNDKLDPLAERQAIKETEAANRAVPTFGQAADDYIAAHHAGWRSAKHAGQWRMTLAEYCAPIRSLPVDQVNVEAVLKVLTPLWTRVPTTASVLRGRIEAILDAARARGHIAADKANPARWKGHLEHLLPPPKKPAAERDHHAAMPYADVPAFFAKLKDSPDSAPAALAFTILTAMRTSEVTDMTWEEVDTNHWTTWSVPGSRMKMGKPHQVPLSDAAVTILKRQWETRGKSRFVFPGALPAKPLSESALKMALKRLGGRDTVHGFRSSFRSWCADKGVAFEVAEQCLAHTVGNAVIQAYQRSSMLERRRPVMQAWANYLSEEPSAKVESLEEGRKRHRKATP
jgi:integrase